MDNKVTEEMRFITPKNFSGGITDTAMCGSGLRTINFK